MFDLTSYHKVQIVDYVDYLYMVLTTEEITQLYVVIKLDLPKSDSMITNHM